MTSFSELSSRLDKLLNFNFKGAVKQTVLDKLTPVYGRYNTARKQKALESILPEYDGTDKSSFKIGDDWSDLYDKIYNYYIEHGYTDTVAHNAAKRDLSNFYKNRLPDFDKFQSMLRTQQQLNRNAKLGIDENGQSTTIQNGII